MPVPAPGASTVLSLRSPADLLVVIPFLLGFHPRDSMVVVCLEDGPGPMLGMSARADLPPPDELDECAQQVVHAVRRRRPAAVVLAVVGGGGGSGGQGPPRRDVVDRLTEEFAEAGIPVRAQAWAAELVAGARWCCYGECGCAGELGDPATTAVAAAAVAAGQVTYADRAGLERLLAPADPSAISRRSALLDVASDASLLDGALSGPAMARRSGRCTRRARRVVGRAAGPRRRRRRAARRRVERLRRPGGDACAIFCVGEQAAAAEQLWTALTVATPDPEAAEPATLLAFCALVRGNGALATVALERAQRARPGHRLSTLLQAAIASGLAPDEIEEWVLAGADPGGGQAGDGRPGAAAERVIRRVKRHASATMVASSVRSGCQPSSVRARSAEATSTAGSPGRRGAGSVGIGRPVTVRQVSITSRTEKPLPLPRLNTWCRPGSAYRSASRCASARSSTWM